MRLYFYSYERVSFNDADNICPTDSPEKQETAETISEIHVFLFLDILFFSINVRTYLFLYITKPIIIHFCHLLHTVRKSPHEFYVYALHYFIHSHYFFFNFLYTCCFAIQIEYFFIKNITQSSSTSCAFT